MERIAYGEDSSHWGSLHRPSGDPRGVVVVIHGGFWRAEYDASLGEPLAADLARRGWVAWNVEYRRVGNGGGTPETFADVVAAIEHLAQVGLPHTRSTVTLGHSAGGHLAVWAATACPQVTGAISQAGVLDLRAAAHAGLGGGAAQALLGHTPTEADAQWDPRQLLPVGKPVVAVHAPGDDLVPMAQSRSYVARAQAAGDDARLVEVPGDHFVHLDTTSAAWRRTVAALEDLG